ncbi:hypothetical protein NC652_037485 [Populus alba x Populus x berolinensis]|nr:hypothetical protein NC651_036291 [Populus alba x Populus x berolinensis]KAJ6865969.1 hypothetical protein NC652_037485 [Populus alba x Populus x berolinensis]
MSKYLVAPFKVSKPTNQEDLKFIQFVFDSSLIGRYLFIRNDLASKAEAYYEQRAGEEGEMCAPQKLYEDESSSYRSHKKKSINIFIS